MTLREQRKTIIKRLSNGEIVRDIATTMGYSPRSIEKEIEVMFCETKCKNTTHLVATFLRKKIIK